MPPQSAPSDADRDILPRLEQRLGRVHARQRLGIESDHEAVFGHGLNFFHPENWYSGHSLLRAALRLTGLYPIGRRNSAAVRIATNRVVLPNLPAAFEGFTLLHLTDLHSDLNPAPIHRLPDLLRGLHYDLCVLTGDFRGQTFGPYHAALDALRTLRPHLRAPVYAVLGNHDTVRMLPHIEDMGIRMLMNETIPLTRNTGALNRDIAEAPAGEPAATLYLSGVDDAHYYRADNLHAAAEPIPPGSTSVLLSHTPEIYRQAAHAGFSLMLSGHTHGGQLCLPGRIPLTLDATLPRRMGAGPWTYASLQGYTSRGVGCSIVPVRFNCPPEITLHTLTRTANEPDTHPSSSPPKPGAPPSRS